MNDNQPDELFVILSNFADYCSIQGTPFGSMPNDREALLKAKSAILKHTRSVEAIEAVLPKKKDERLNKTSGTQTSPPQLIDIEARGYNQAINEIRAALELDK